MPIRLRTELLVILILFGLACCNIETSRAQETTGRRPNIVFILADDMGWPDLACYGHEFHETPVLDKLAAQGIRFTDFYATPVCSSTRSTILSGQNSARTGVTDFIPGHFRPFEKLVVPKIDHHLKAGVRTPGDVLKTAGYTTAYFGKWHMGDKDHQPNDHGYDITERQLGDAFYQTHTNVDPGPKKIDFLTDASLWFIEQNQDKPFFLTVSHYAVHIPVEGSEAAIAKYRQKKKPATGVNHPIYAAMVEDLDTSVGRVLHKIEQLNLAQDTIVVFASDNGGLSKTYTAIGETVSTNAPLRDEKGTLYEGGVRVPLIVRWPGVITPGTVSAEPTTTADLLPTFSEMAGATLPDQPIDGVSLVAVLKESQVTLGRDEIFFHYPHYHHSTPAGAIRAGNWKLIEFFDDGRVELYNLADDLEESHDVASAHPSKANELQSRLAIWRQNIGARMPAENPDFDPDRSAEWWSRGTGKPLDIEAMRRHFDSGRGK